RADARRRVGDLVWPIGGGRVEAKAGRQPVPASVGAAVEAAKAVECPQGIGCFGIERERLMEIQRAIEACHPARPADPAIAAAEDAARRAGIEDAGTGRIGEELPGLATVGAFG